MCWLLLACIQCNSVIRLQSAAARDAPRRRRGDPADAPPTGKRDPGDRAVRARAPRSAVCRGRRSRGGVSVWRSFLLYFFYLHVFFKRAGLSRRAGAVIYPLAVALAATCPTSYINLNY